MDQDPLIEDESSITKRVEHRDLNLETGLEKLERPPGGDFVAGLRSFVTWVEGLVK